MNNIKLNVIEPRKSGVIKILDKQMFVILLVFFIGSLISCQKDTSSSKISLNPFVNESKRYYEKNLANSPSYSLNSSNLTLDWEKALSLETRTGMENTLKIGDLQSNSLIGVKLYQLMHGVISSCLMQKYPVII